MSTQRGKARPTIFISFQVHLNTINKLILPYTVKSKEGVAHQIWCAISVADSPPYTLYDMVNTQKKVVSGTPSMV